MNTERGLSLNQPYASLCVIDKADGSGKVKGWETRSKPLPKTITPDVDVFLCSTVKAPLFGIRQRDGVRATLPLGAVVAVVRFTESLPIEPCSANYSHACLSGGGLLHHTPLDNPIPTGETEFDITDQLPYGDWRDGRHAWRIADVRPLAEPVSVIGDGVHHQGFWRPSAATVAAVREQVSE